MSRAVIVAAAALALVACDSGSPTSPTDDDPFEDPYEGIDDARDDDPGTGGGTESLNICVANSGVEVDFTDRLVYYDILWTNGCSQDIVVKMAATLYEDGVRGRTQRGSWRIGGFGESDGCWPEYSSQGGHCRFSGVCCPDHVEVKINWRTCWASAASCLAPEAP